MTLTTDTPAVASPPTKRRIGRISAVVVIIVTKDSLPDERSEARSLLLVHRPEAQAGGMCKGCYEFACHVAWWPCPQARWAQRVVHASDRGVQL